jgi:hypothetical protein
MKGIVIFSGGISSSVNVLSQQRCSFQSRILLHNPHTPQRTRRVLRRRMPNGFWLVRSCGANLVLSETQSDSAPHQLRSVRLGSRQQSPFLSCPQCFWFARFFHGSSSFDSQRHFLGKARVFKSVHCSCSNEFWLALSLCIFSVLARCDFCQLFMGKVRAIILSIWQWFWFQVWSPAFRKAAQQCVQLTVGTHRVF